jgi:hypothetical protein
MQMRPPHRHAGTPVPAHTHHPPTRVQTGWLPLGPDALTGPTPLQGGRGVLGGRGNAAEHTGLVPEPLPEDSSAVPVVPGLVSARVWGCDDDIKGSGAPRRGA